MTDEEAGAFRAEIKDARQNLFGALIDIERAHGYADAVCIDTMKRVIDQLRSLEKIARSDCPSAVARRHVTDTLYDQEPKSHSIAHRLR